MKAWFIVALLVPNMLLLLLSSLLHSQHTKNNPEIRTVQVGFSADLFHEVDSRDAQVAIKIWTKEIFKGMGETVGTIYEPNVTIYNDLLSLKKALLQGNMEFLSISTLDYLEIKGIFDFEPILMGEFEGNVGEENILLVHRDKGLTELAGLQSGDLILHPGHRGLIAQMWLSTLLMKQGLPDCEKFFGTIRTFNKASQGILPVFFKQADACIVNRQSFETMVELNPQLKTQLQILATSPVVAYGLSLLSKNFDLETRNEIIKIALDIDRHTRGKEILILFRQDKAIRFKPNHIESVVQLIEQYNYLKKQPEIKKASKGIGN